MSENEIQEHLAALVVRRQELRAGGASRDELEHNRVELLQAQWDLSHALIARHLPAVSQAA